MNLAWRGGMAAVLWGAMALAPACAADYFLTIGGGYSPLGNQISLEKNVLLFQQMVGETYGPDGAAHDIYFADGDHPGRDIQLHDADRQWPRAHVLAARIYQSEKYFGYEYRTHQVPGIRGGSSRQNIDAWFNDVGARLTADDRLFLYITAHGGRAADAKKAPHNTSFYCWNNQKVEMTDLARLLDKLPADTPVVMVMVQCFSGGFSHLIFSEGDQAKGAVGHNRCGFFATVHDRVAAGCTPDINEDNYREYSSYFWAALRGKTRTGQAIETPDYDGDGVVSLAEAHAYALIASTTIDISIKTSDAFLRAFSKLEGAEGLLTADTPIAELLAVATPADRAVVDALSAELELTDENRGAATRQAAKQADDEKKRLEQEHKKHSDEIARLAREISGALANQWPELANRWNPQVTELLTRDAEAFVAAIESHASFSRFEQLYDERAAVGERKFDAERRWVKCQRLLRTLENIALAANLPQVAEPELVERYAQLAAAEQQSFGLPATAEPSDTP